MTATPPPGTPEAPRARTSRWSSLSWRLAILIILLLAITAGVTTVYAASTVRANEEANNDESMRNVHRSVARTVHQLDGDLSRFRATQLANRKQLLKDLTNAQLQAMTQLNDAVRRGEMSLAAAQSVAGQMLFDYRYGQGDYFFAFTPDMVSIVEPNPTFRGDMLDYRDPNGKLFFREFRDVALGPGAGYVDYVGTRVGASEPAPKISYVAMFRPWQWVVGTGVYLDDIATESRARLVEAEADLARSLERVEFADTGFFFVMSRDGGVVAGPSSAGVRDLERTGWGKQLAGVLERAVPARGGDIVEVDAPARFEGASGEWHFGVSAVGAEDWVLVSAVPQRELTRHANELAWRQVLLSVLVLGIGLAIGLLVSRRIVRPVRDLTGASLALEEDRFDPASLDAAAARRDEVGGLARAFRRMAAEVVERERALRERVSRLQVVIDRRKVDEEITQITESDFFRRLEEQADELRRRPPGGSA